MSDAQIVYRSGVKFFGGRSKMPAWAEDRLRGYMDDAGVPVLQISSGYRTPEDQARIMYDNIQAHGLSSQRALYGATSLSCFPLPSPTGALVRASCHERTASADARS